MPEQRPAAVTPLTADMVAQSMVVAWRRVFGAPPARASILLLTSQIRHETGYRECICWNLGNAKHVDGDGRDWCVFRTREVIDGKEVHLDQAFRAYGSLDEGMVDYLLLLRKRFANAWPFVLSGDPVGFVHALKRQGYFTDTEDTYERDVASAFHLYEATLHFDLNPPLVDDDTAARAQALVEMSLRDLSESVTLPEIPAADSIPDTERNS